MSSREKLTNLLEKYPYLTHLSKFKPLSFYDLETTGIDPLSDRIVEICIMRMDRGEVTVLEYLIDPLIEIPIEASNVHGITNEVIANKKAVPFKNKAREIHDFLKGSVLVTFNGKNFDIPLLIVECDRANVIFDHDSFETLDVRGLYVKMNQRRLQDAFAQYVGREMLEAHKASADVEATMSILEKQMEFHEEFQNMTLRTLIDFAEFDNKKDAKVDDIKYLDYSKNFYIKDGTVFYNFGKNKGLPALSDRTYLKWVATSLKKDKADFAFMPDTRRIAMNLLENGKPRK